MTDDDRKAIGPEGVAVAEALGEAVVDLERWGQVTWPDPSGGPLLGRMSDGFWTPWHTAADLLQSARLGCDIAYLREPTQAEGDAHAHAASARECFVPMGSWTGRRCRVCDRWTWGGPAACERCVALEERDAARQELAAARAAIGEAWFLRPDDSIALALSRKTTALDRLCAEGGKK